VSVAVARMKIQLLIATLAVGFLAGLGIAAVRGDFSHPAVAPVQDFPEQVAMAPPPVVAVRPVTPAPAADALMPLQPAAPEPAASDPQPDGVESADALPAPTYDQETAARDRAAAHSARSR
jgi:hypothetical protein